MPVLPLRTLAPWALAPWLGLAAAPPLAVAAPAPQLARTADQEPDEAYARRVTPLVQMVQAARPAVVFIETNVPSVRQDFFGRVFRKDRRGSGSGVVIYEEGYVVTNYHVVRGANEILVRFDPSVDETPYPADLVSWDEAEDLALLRIRAEGLRGEQGFPTIPLGTSSDLMIGEPVAAIGNPYGQTLSVSQGIISGLHRDVRASGLSFTGLIQTDASINPGNSGGPLLNINGELIGINTVMNAVAENIGFAIPVDQVRKVLREVLLQPENASAWLGFEVEEDRLAVCEITAGGPAEAAGLRIGDLVVAIDGREVAGGEDYRLARLAVRPGQEVRLRLRREGEGEVREVRLRAWDRADYLTYLRAGVTVESIVVSYHRMLRVRTVRPDGPAAELGLRPGDILEAVQPAGRRAERVGTPEELAFLLARLPAGTELRLDVWRDDDGDGRLELTGGRSEAYKGWLELR